MKRALVLGGSGFIGHHMVRKLKQEGFWTRAVDWKYPEFSLVDADDFILGDLCDPLVCNAAIDQKFDEIYQFAADMGGAGYIFTGENDADILQNSASINLNVLKACDRRNSKNIFYSSSACIYPKENQLDPSNPDCSESSAYPANPDSEYGWEKLFSERLYLSYARNKGFRTRIGRYHNIFGEEGTWSGGREKVPAAVCRKIAEAQDGEEIEIWGDGLQTRSFLHISDCLSGTQAVMRSEYEQPLNIGSDEMVSINELVSIVESIAEMSLARTYKLDAPKGVNGRNSDNTLINEYLGWAPNISLRRGLQQTFDWIHTEMSVGK